MIKLEASCRYCDSGSKIVRWTREYWATDWKKVVEEVLKVYVQFMSTNFFDTASDDRSEKLTLFLGQGTIKPPTGMCTVEEA